MKLPIEEFRLKPVPRESQKPGGTLLFTTFIDAVKRMHRDATLILQNQETEQKSERRHEKKKRRDTSPSRAFNGLARVRRVGGGNFGIDYLENVSTDFLTRCSYWTKYWKSRV